MTDPRQAWVEATVAKLTDPAASALMRRLLEPLVPPPPPTGGRVLGSGECGLQNDSPAGT